MNTNPSPAIVPAGRVLHGFGEEVVFHLTGNETNGQLTTWMEIIPPGGGPPLHYHENEDEYFVVLEGKVSFFQNNQWTEVGPGGAVFLPRNSVHAFKNTGDQTSRMMVTATPSGFENFFARCAEEFAREDGPNMAEIVRIANEHGIHFVK